MMLHKALKTTKKLFCDFLQAFLLLSYLQEPCTALFSTLHALAAQPALNMILSGLKEQTFEEKFCSESIAQLLRITLGEKK